MNKISVTTLVAAAVLCAAPISLHQSQDKGLSLSLDKAEAVIGRPLTPGSIAGVHRRVERRTYRRGYYGYDHYAYANRPYAYYGHHYRPYGYSAAQADTDQLSCRAAAKLQYPNERQMRKAFKKECKAAYKAGHGTAAHA